MVKVMKLVKLSMSSLLIYFIAFPASAQSDSDIIVASVSYVDRISEVIAGNPSDKIIRLSNFQKITDTSSYTNQPYFINGDSALVYTQMIKGVNISQMDIFVYDFATQSSTNLSNSLTSEYSATPTPDGKELSVIRVNSEGKQELWSLQFNDGEAIKNLLPGVEPVGYHVWDGATKVLLFVLGEPNTLRLASINKPTDLGRVLDTKIGPSLWSIPNSNLYSYTKNIDETTWQLRSVNTQTNSAAALVTMPVGSVYYAWSPESYAVTAVKNKLYQWKYESGDNKWTEFVDLTEQCPGDISRVSFSSKGDKIAIVCARGAPTD
ncbi:MAG: hypothetical protein ACI9DQ_001728 [Glaciecola sp.]|jgi:hypothetical protein